MAEAPVTGRVRRHFVDHDHPQGLYTVRAHVVTDKTEGDVITPGQTEAHAARAGEVLVETGRPDVYTVYPADAWKELGLEAVEDQQDLSTEDTQETEEPVFDPNDHTAQEVRLYLRGLPDTDEGNAEYDRVTDAEREGNNRQSAFPRR